MAPRPEPDGVLARVRASVPPQVKRALRPMARRLGLAAAPHWWQAPRPRRPRPPSGRARPGAWCNICGWSGDRFDGHAHSESALCPTCRSIARDRFLFWCFLSRTRWQRALRVLETSPRLGHEYRTAMRSWFAYRSSDFDLGAHLADIALDLQRIDLPDASLDVLLTPHVLEHVPDTALALSEIHRVLSPGGRMYLQVPLLQGTTAAPAEPEFHADDTLVHWRFGWDLTATLRGCGFDVAVLVPAELARRLERHDLDGAHASSEFDLASIARDAVPADLVAVLSDEQARVLGIAPAYQFVVWECVRRTNRVSRGRRAAAARG